MKTDLGQISIRTHAGHHNSIHTHFNGNVTGSELQNYNMKLHKITTKIDSNSILHDPHLLRLGLIDPSSMNRSMSA